jgi:hypothetical protein
MAPAASVYSPLGQDDGSALGAPTHGLSEQEKAGYLSQLLFMWISPLLAKGYSKKVRTPGPRIAIVAFQNDTHFTV